MPRRPCRVALPLTWLISSIGVVVLLGLAACAMGPMSAVQIDWVDVVQFLGIRYLASTATLGRAPTDSDLGPVFATVQFKVADTVHDPHYHFNDGDAAFLDAGTPVYSVRGYAPSFRLAARDAGRLTFYEADTNPHATTGANLLDIGGKVHSIAVNSEQDGKTVLGAVTNPTQVASLVTMVVGAPVNQQSQECNGTSYVLVFQMDDDTAVARGFCLRTGELDRGILLPPAFGDAIQRAVVTTPTG
jgi:hypothetical protein